MCTSVIKWIVDFLILNSLLQDNRNVYIERTMAPSVSSLDNWFCFTLIFLFQPLLQFELYQPRSFVDTLVCIKYLVKRVVFLSLKIIK